MTQTAAVAAARTEIVASVPGPNFFTQEKLPTIALHIVITSDTIARVITRYGQFGAQFAAFGNLARGWFVYRLSDDTFRRNRTILDDFPYRVIRQAVEG